MRGGSNSSTIVLSDIHFGAGASTLAEPRHVDYLIWEIWRYGGGCDKMILLGDILDLWRARPERAMKESKYFLQRLDDLDIPVSYVIGNHDHHLMIMAQEQNLLDRASRGEFFPAYSTSMNWSSTINGLHLDMHYPMYISRTPSVSVLFTHGHHLDGIQGFSLQIVEHIRRLSGDEVTVADLERMMAYTYESIYLSSYMEEIVDVEERIWGASLIFDKVKAGLLKSLRSTPVQRQYEPIMQFMKDRRIGHVDCFVYGDTHRAGVYRRDGGFLAANSGCFTTDGIQTAEQTPNTYLIIDGEDLTLRQLGCEEPLYAGEI